MDSDLGLTEGVYVLVCERPKRPIDGEFEICGNFSVALSQEGRFAVRRPIGSLLAILRQTFG